MASESVAELLLPRIILARHGTPAVDFKTPIPGHGLAQWLECERDAALASSQHPSAEVRRLATTAGCLTVSPLRRSVESARLIAPSSMALVDEHFREAALPSAITSRLRLRPGLWAALARTAWFCGWSAGVESFKAARERAAEAAQILIAHAEAHGSVALIGHGLMNILIAGRLRALRWKGPLFPRPRHWAFGVYVH